MFSERDTDVSFEDKMDMETSVRAVQQRRTFDQQLRRDHPVRVALDVLGKTLQKPLYSSPDCGPRDPITLGKMFVAAATVVAAAGWAAHQAITERSERAIQ